MRESGHFFVYIYLRMKLCVQKMRQRAARVNECKSRPSSPWFVSYYQDCKRKFKYFKSRIAAEQFASELNKEYALPQDFQIPVSERIAFTTIKNKLESASLQFDDVINLLDDYISKKVIESLVPQISKEKAIDMFVSKCINKGLRFVSVEGYRRLIPKLLKDHSLHMTKTDAQNLINSQISPLSAKRALSSFYSYLVEKGIVAENIFKSVKIAKVMKDKNPPKIISVKDTYTLFHELLEKWKPAFALMAFAGIRPGELTDCCKEDILRIGDIDFANKKITIRAIVAKDRKCRILENLPENIWSWLEPLKVIHPSFRVIPNAYKAYQRAKDGLSIKLSKDILRHSFATYGYHKLGGEHTVEIMGHITGYGVFARHYKGLGNMTDAIEYFNITPETVKTEMNRRTQELEINNLKKSA